MPVLFLAADLDSLLPLEGMMDLFSRTPAPKQMLILKNADHFHFCDSVEWTHDLFMKMGGLSPILDPGAKGGHGSMSKARPSSELCPGKHAYLFIQGLGLAHMDSKLKGSKAANDLLNGDVKAILAEKGITAETIL